MIMADTMKPLGVIWITGASSGIGASLAYSYAAQGWQVIATSRNLSSLQQTFADNALVHCLACDVSDEAAVMDAAAEIECRFGYLTHVVVNAGHCEYVDEMPIKSSMFQRLWAVNVMGAVHTVNAALPLLQAAKAQCGRSGHVVTIASQVVFAPFTRAECYGATKAALDYLMKSWRLDLAAYDIDVSVIYPGFVDTPLTRKNSFSMPFIQTTDQATQRIQVAIEKRVRQCIFPRRLYALLLLSKIFPQSWQALMLKGQHASMQQSQPLPHGSKDHLSNHKKDVL